MTVLFHELKQNKLSLIIWSAAISFMLGICIIIYPDMSAEMQEVTDIFANMGSFSEAFGMDKINFGEFKGYFAIECGNVLGLGGAIFAAILGVSALAKEERDRTAEYLLTHPIPRSSVITQKLISVVVQIFILNAVVAAVTIVSTLLIKERISAYTFFIIFLAYFLLQIEISCITFGISAFLSVNGLGIGIGVSFLTYFMNIVANLTKELKFIKYFTPFGFADGSDLVSRNAIRIEYVLIGFIISTVAVTVAYLYYLKKDIH